jgi:glycosyltransferase involved in cell wall biosynthesis
MDMPRLLETMRRQWGFVHVSPLAAGIGRAFLPGGARQFVLANPIDAVAQSPVAVESNRHFLYVGHLLPEKGCLDLAEAARSFDVAFMGAGPSARAITRINPRARLLRPGGGDEVNAALGGCRALVLPSLWYETFGLVVAEALSRGVPVIISDRVGAGAMVNHGLNGLVYQAGDRHGLRACLARVNRPGRAAAMGRAAYHGYWAVPPTLDAHVDGLIGAYEEMLKAA